MAPSKAINSQNKPVMMVNAVKKSITTRNQKAADQMNIKPLVTAKDLRFKRKADASPLKDKMIKRSALGNITNAIGKSLGVQLADPKKVVKKTQAKPVSSTYTLRNTEKVIVKPIAVIDKPSSKLKNVSKVTRTTKKLEVKKGIPQKSENQKPIDVEKSNDSSLYVSALEDLSQGNDKKIELNIDRIEEETIIQKIGKSKRTSVNTPAKQSVEYLDKTPVRQLPPGVLWDFDVENWRDPYQVSQYAMEIFEYLKSRERNFLIGDYMEKQVCLSRWMRSLLVDWMVEVQESFELNHETLYLAIKLVDLYLTKVTVGKETLQLLGAASLFIASKFDERIPPMIEDFLYICDGAYSQRELIRMEMNVLKIVDFDLGIPLSYRFLRRYARCIKISMPTLTLARYILEYSLMDYATIMFSDSKLASAALFLALQMKDLGGWTPTLEYYTGYTIDDIKHIVNLLNQGLHKKNKDALSTVRNKYSHNHSGVDYLER
ncbi:Similar to CycB3: G2/mitotic-specific cyclin-B3 (Drosophila melanogaster) [Cotesia congregata]|uniref:Similar to CycB3: G2/mitotic-specific cyclin-B3 (Drosophila melanogaster) n=1 Tax=Cotesia congregata TaxID=51543 RepID=A0A8J2HBP1_COTCN|nr:Similar to CycB3: G2/mitotic-specific cyclin-B3 (Drosophila melanogaster) [Cotesia congregata]